MHQLRIQAACRGMPIVDDPLYGSAAMEDTNNSRHQPIALHALAIEYDDPENRNRVAVQAPLPETTIWVYWRNTIAHRLQR